MTAAATSRIYGLLKFGKREHIEALRNKGALYMKPLSYFSKLESDMARGDAYEGATRIFQPKDVGEITFDFPPMKKFIAKGSELGGPLQIGLHKTAACNIYCMFAITKPVDGMLLDSQNLQFGDACLLVLDPPEFINRVVAAATRAGLTHFEDRLVQYFDAEQYSGEVGRFRKRSIFAYQNEFRIAVEPGSDMPIELFAGSLTDITSEILPLAEANAHLDFSTKRFREAGFLQ